MLCGSRKMENSFMSKESKTNKTTKHKSSSPIIWIFILAYRHKSSAKTKKGKGDEVDGGRGGGREKTWKTVYIVTTCLKIFSRFCSLSLSLYVRFFDRNDFLYAGKGKRKTFIKDNSRLLSATSLRFKNFGLSERGERGARKPISFSNNFSSWWIYSLVY